MNFLRISFLTLAIFILSHASSLGQDCDGLSENLFWNFVSDVDGPLSEGDLFTIDCYVDNFTNVLSFQYSIIYDPTVMEFKSIDNTESILIGPVDSQIFYPGEGALLWTNLNGEGQTIPSNSFIYKFVFEAVGSPGDCADIVINGSFLDLEIAFELDSGVFCTELEEINYQFDGTSTCLDCGEDIFIQNNFCNGDLNFSACGGSGNYTYSIGGLNLSDQGTFTDEDMLSYNNLNNEGTIIISVADDIGNNTAVSLSNEPYDLPIILGEAFCSSESTMLSAQDNFTTYEWIDPFGNVLAPIANEPWNVEVNSSGLYSLNVTIGNCFESTQINIEEQQAPFIITQSFTVCNSSDNGSAVIALNSIFENTTGVFYGEDGELSELNFNDVEVGNYTYTIEVEGIAPCENELFELEVEVINCGCPEISLVQFGNLCNNIEQSINLYDFTSAETSLNGMFTITQVQGELAFLQPDSNGFLQVDQNSEIGEFQLVYTLDNVPPGCTNSVSQTFNIYQQPIVEFISPESVCNTDSLGNTTVIDLSSYVLGATGTWQDDTGTNILNSIFDFNGFAPGIYNFKFMSNTALSPCSDVTIDFEIEVIDCITSINSVTTSPLVGLFPNPTLGQLNIELSSKTELIIYSSAGRKLKRFTLEKGINSITIDEMDNGFYLLEFYQEGVLMEIEKLVKH